MKITIPPKIAAQCIHEPLLTNAIETLFAQQLSVWEMARDRYRDLLATESRVIDVAGVPIRLQFAPARIVSTAVSVDISALKQRPCFLCPENRPAVQEGILCDNEYTILVNPFPIFSRHLTIPAVTHTPQRIKNRLGHLLHFATQLPDCVLFYNGPQSGASAPDHMHFQAGNKGFLPFEKEWEQLKNNKAHKVSDKDDAKIYYLPDYPQAVFVLESVCLNRVIEIFDQLYAMLDACKGESPEPMMNLLCDYNQGVFRLWLFPRKAHRPRQYFATGDERILVSPGAVDLGGVLILPRKEDFAKVTACDIEDILSQVSIDRPTIEYILEKI